MIEQRPLRHTALNSPITNTWRHSIQERKAITLHFRFLLLFLLWPNLPRHTEGKKMIYCAQKTNVNTYCRERIKSVQTSTRRPLKVRPKMVISNRKFNSFSLNTTTHYSYVYIFAFNSKRNFSPKVPFPKYGHKWKTTSNWLDLIRVILVWFNTNNLSTHNSLVRF